MAASRAQLDHLAAALRGMNRGPRVLETATITIPGQGQQAGFEPGAPGCFTQDRYKVPYAAVAVLNAGTSPVIVSTGPAQGSAPGGGQGQVIVPALSFAAWNMEGSSLSIYGPAGTQISYSVFTDSVMPSASLNVSSPVNTAPTLVIPAAPAAGANFSYVMPGPMAQQLASVVFQFVSDAVVANRFLSIQVLDAAGHLIAKTANQAAVLASTAITISAWPTASQQNSATGTAILPLFGGLWLQPGWTLSLIASGIDAGDQINLIALSFAPPAAPPIA
jgi:hypothetical protein